MTNDRRAADIVLRESPLMTEPMRSLYLSSFPAGERRPLHLLEHMLATPGRWPRLLLVQPRGADTPVGFLTLWQLPSGIYYIEHFATLPSMRGRGIGAAALGALLRMLPRDARVVIEVERPEGDTERRRIAFYTRAGFTLRGEYDYIQPPYSAGLPPVSLRLMTIGDIPSGALDSLATELRSNIYGVDRKP